MKTKRIYIYKIYFPTSNRSNPHYVGKSQDLSRRMFVHLENKSLVGNALRKYDDWNIEVLHTCKTCDEANRIEIEEIRHYNCVTPNGYNQTRGGDGGDTWSGKKNLKQSKSRRGEGNPFYNKKHTEESKNKISNSMQGKNKGDNCSVLSKETARKIVTKRNKENNPMKDSKIARKQGKVQRSIQIGKKNGNYKNGKYTKEAKIKRLQERINSLT